MFLYQQQVASMLLWAAAQRRCPSVSTIDYSAMYTATATSIASGPLNGVNCQFAGLPSEAVISRTMVLQRTVTLRF